MTKFIRYTLPALALTAGTSAMAAVPADVSGSISGSLADGQEVGWLVVGAIAGIFVFKLVQRVIR